MGRPPCCDRSNVKRGLWTAEEDAKILAYVSAHGTGNWTLVPKKAGLNRCGKSCRLRWTNYLRPDLKHESFTPEEEQLIIDFHRAIGSRWSMIARQLPGRTDNDVKNYWNTKLRKKLAKMGIDPVTHKPIPQVMSEYGNISRLPNSTSLRSSSSILPMVPHANHLMMANHSLVPKAEPVGRNFYSGISVAAWEHLPAQFHENIDNQTQQPPYLLNEVTSPSSSSSSTLTTQLLNSSKQGSIQPSQAPCPLSTQPNLCANESHMFCGEDLENHMGTFPPATEPLSVMGYEPTVGNEANVVRAAYGTNKVHPNPIYQASYTGNSFVDSILDRDSQIQSNFPELLDGFFDE